MKMTFALAAAALLSSVALGASSVSAAPMFVSGLQAGQSSVAQVRMTHSERMMMKKRMMRKKMMRKRMMHRM
ncbi:hypothetical protein LOK46_32425 (plasmid) [Methylobacterium sp. NMS14P]|uniref:hypothetical protein n=1 Tax=Methylobacterium sp. NMS14P TaxID=2894310 RepID=UPI0023581987|nr:hypothetical protein [Methylobacterium sp. NMS14P]WCS28899.1 hypothetical protein LOK46_32425 [Methylobacterium sp. NMS14P]